MLEPGSTLWLLWTLNPVHRHVRAPFTLLQPCYIEQLYWTRCPNAYDSWYSRLLLLPIIHRAVIFVSFLQSLLAAVGAAVPRLPSYQAHSRGPIPYGVFNLGKDMYHAPSNSSLGPEVGDDSSAHSPAAHWPSPELVRYQK
ncbi:hypothetical protein BJ912DRAFT_1151046 [Pholiota molesta]|nr:hypothetical protein BJ912DRAFT_1151046 [Pholiota molesta]